MNDVCNQLFENQIVHFNIQNIVTNTNYLCTTSHYYQYDPVNATCETSLGLKKKYN